MSASVAQQLDGFARRLIPFGVTFVLVLLEAVPLSLPFPTAVAVAPSFVLIALFFWTVYRPELVPAVVVFAAGLLLDVVSGAPLGINTLVLLLVCGGVRSQRRFLVDKPFAVVWLGFLIAAIYAGVLYWVLYAIIHGTLPYADRLIAQLSVTVLIYPLFAWLLGRSQRAMNRGV